MRQIDGHKCEQIVPSFTLLKRAERWMDGRGRDRPGYWAKFSKRVYAYREHTGDITFWRTVGN